MSWTVGIDLIKPWLDNQDLATIAHIEAAISELEKEGPRLGRPLVDRIKGSSVHHMKELRPASPGKSEIRILFAFDPERQAIMLFAGDKSSGKRDREKWNGWYKTAIPRAEKLCFEHLKEGGWA
ncbi:type II toxin-antitoxin system RelE/ParE family toxin [Gordonibacter massiliensis (ex Traore et al. 2017)]|uniref:type II toxin-antitoxin system RelE/ParE family toxin n=1 Tax=Gordonibacter massiliensis (ex Traore et al. 2017) TaxID=1841863 RepID=UPI001C8C859B|nr:type II toxin-antitoxin system RelE/ParE family toxin [Gordonibacter massiliensis (ex Traore et al. 2017)]MBX9034794.1 type II toxin-antitoxin system RelE/ParE family toxin [Gordonibacter massiliensis (ex Traore et al. 2017)]